MSIENKDTYYVAVKVFLEKEGQLLILKDKFGDWDLPGGRIRKDEFETPLERIIERKMAEELGSDFRYEIGSPKVFMRHERIEQVPGRPTVRIFAVGYSGVYREGEIRLSELHTTMLWVRLNEFRPREYFEGGWLTGVEEYIRIRNAS